MSVINVDALVASLAKLFDEIDAEDCPVCWDVKENNVTIHEDHCSLKALHNHYNEIKEP